MLGLAGVLLLGAAAAAGAVVWALEYYDVTPRLLVVKAMERAGIQSSWAHRLLAPPPRYTDHRLDGRLRLAHPRILLPELAAWDGQGLAPVMRERLRLYEAQGIPVGQYPPCRGNNALRQAFCWVSTGRAAAGSAGVRALTGFRIEPPASAGSYGNAWQLALAYDLLARHPQLTASTRAEIEHRLDVALADYLAVLDGEAASLWHGRATLAANAWLCAVVLTPDDPTRLDHIRRAQGHFLEAIAALRLAEAWPGGYNYWINTRGLTLALAAAGYLNGLEGARRAGEVREALRRVGLWTLYSTRADNHVVGLGDEGPRVDLKDETRRVIDLIAQLTRDPIFATFSRYLQQVHGRESYYRGYRWQFRLFNDPTVAPLPDIEPGSLAGLDNHLPRAELFGRGAMNLFVARTGWAEDDMLVTMRAGHSLSHHGHYDAGHFTLFKGAPLAISNATYGGSVSVPHRLYYGIRTVSKNSLLVLRPDEQVRPTRLLTRNVVDGGQRMTLPTGSRIRSVAHWRENLDQGWHLEGGRVLAATLDNDRLAYLKADLTRAYDNPVHDSQGRDGKVRHVTRELLVLLDEDLVLVHDDVAATDPSYTKKWLLHLPRKPQVIEALALKGNTDDGILQSNAFHFSVENAGARLDGLRLLPANAVLRLVGGPSHAYYVETDGNDRDLDGANFSGGAQEKHWFDRGRWRVEIQPRRPRIQDDFLVALRPSLGNESNEAIQPLQLGGQGAIAALATDRSVIVVAGDTRDDELHLELPAEQKRLVILGVPASAEISLDVDGEAFWYWADAAGVAEIPLPSGATSGSRLELRF